MRFKKFFIEITNVCNLSCSFCPRTKRPPRFMDGGLFEKILGDVAGKAEDLFFHVLGEPLLHPELGRFLGLCARRGFRVKLVTNGTLIGRSADMLLSSPAVRQVSFSLHSIGAGNSRADAEGCLSDVFSFARKAAGTGTVVFLRLWNQDETGRLSDGDRAVLEAVRREFGFGRPVPGRMDPGRALRVTDRIFLSSMERFDWPSLAPGRPEEEGFCAGVSRQAAVLADGLVVPCCLDAEGAVPLGDIRERSLDDILSGARARGIAEAFSRGLAREPLCRKCTYKRRFRRSIAAWRRMPYT